MNQLTENEYEMLKRISEEQLTNYEIKDIDGEYFISKDNLIAIIEDLHYEIDKLKEEKEQEELDFDGIMDDMRLGIL
jgi:hypothetical protein